MMYEVVRCGRLSVCKGDFKNSMTSDLVVQADVKDGRSGHMSAMRKACKRIVVVVVAWPLKDAELW